MSLINGCRSMQTTSYKDIFEKIRINSRETIELNLENFGKGIYFIKFSGKNNIALRKIAKL